MQYDGEIIRQLRYQKGWTQLDLANELMVSTTTVARWERNEYPPSELSKQKLDATFSDILDNV